MTTFKGFLGRGELRANTSKGTSDFMTASVDNAVAEIASQWANDWRWAGVQRTYGPDDVVRLRGSVHVECSLARQGAERLWSLLHNGDYVSALGALTGAQAVEMVKAGLKAIYLSGWQVAADANLSEQRVPRPEPVRRDQRPCSGPPHQQRPATRRPDRVG